MNLLWKCIDLRFEEEILKKDCVERYALRYIRFINHIRGLNRKKGARHHILPKGSFEWGVYKSFKTNPWNLCVMTDREHYIAHLLLYLAFPDNDSIVFSFNMLRNFSGVRRSSRAYEEHRIMTSQAVSRANSGLIRDDKFRATVSVRMSGKRTVRLKSSGVCIHIKTEEFDQEVHEGHRVGYKHSEETKRKIGKEGKRSYINPDVPTINRMFYEGEQPEGWVLGGHHNLSQSAKNRFVGLLHYHDPITGESGRFGKGEQPEGWISGRVSGFSKGLAVANDNKVSCIDLARCISTKIPKADYDTSIHAPFSGLGTDLTMVFVYKDWIVTNMKTLIKMMRDDGLLVSGKIKVAEATSYRVVPHKVPRGDKVGLFNQTYANKGLVDMGVEIIPLVDFDIGKYSNKEIYQR